MPSVNERLLPPSDSDSLRDAPESRRELNRLEVLRGLNISIWEGAFSTIHGSLTAGAFLTGFALWLGADNLALGLLTAIPTFAGLIQIVASYFGQRPGGRKPFVAGFAIAGRTLWLPILLLPLALPRGIALYGFLVLFALSFILLNVTVPAWTSWMSDLVPADHRGRYFARRNIIAGIVGMVIGLPAAWFLDFTTRRHHWEGVGFGALFGMGVIGGILSFLTLLRQPEPPPHQAIAASPSGMRAIVDFYKAPFADLNFRRLMFFNMVFGMGQFFAAPFFTVYALQNLHLNYVWLQALATLTSLSGLGSMALWGYLADKFGNKPLLAIGVVGVFTLPLQWALTSPAKPELVLLQLTVNNLCGGLFWAGVSLTQFNLLIRMSPPDKTGVYVATMAAVTGLTGGIAPLAGGMVMHQMQEWHGVLFGMPLLNFHVVFAIAASLRLAGLLFLKPITDSSSISARTVLMQLSEANPRAWSHIRQLRSSRDEETRLRATTSLATSRTRLAVSELISALRDPSLAVREEAARALGEIGDPQAVHALVAALGDPSTGLANEAADALGRIGDRRANPALIALLFNTAESYAREDRVAAIRALGFLGGSDAAHALLKMLEPSEANETRKEEEKEAAVRALGEIGEPQAARALAALLNQGEVPRPLRLALVRALGELSDPVSLPALRSQIPSALHDGVLFPLLADALARLDDSSSIPLLLDGLALQESAVARKQAAHAIGSLLGEGEGIYSLLAQDEFARDAAISRLIEEMQREVRMLDRSRDLSVALEAYLTEDYARCIRVLASVSRIFHNVPSTAHPISSDLSHAALEYIVDSVKPPYPVEIVLISLFALRGALK